MNGISAVSEDMLTAVSSASKSVKDAASSAAKAVSRDASCLSDTVGREASEVADKVSAHLKDIGVDTGVMAHAAKEQVSELQRLLLRREGRVFARTARRSIVGGAHLREELLVLPLFLRRELF